MILIVFFTMQADMNPNEIKVSNCLPIHARNDMPPHRVCCCPNTVVIGMSHQTLLQAVAAILDGEHKPTGGSWYCDLINELLYRGIIKGEMYVLKGPQGLTGDIPYVFPSPALPHSRTEWTQAYVYMEGFTLPAQETQK